MPKGDRDAILTPGGTYQSRIKASSKYDEKFKKVLIRVPANQKDALDKYARDNEVSLNELILRLLEQETRLQLLNR